MGFQGSQPQKNGINWPIGLRRGGYLQECTGVHWHATAAFSRKAKGCPADLRGKVNHVAEPVYSWHTSFIITYLTLHEQIASLLPETLTTPVANIIDRRLEMLIRRTELLISLRVGLPGSELS